MVIEAPRCALCRARRHDLGPCCDHLFLREELDSWCLGVSPQIEHEDSMFGEARNNWSGELVGDHFPVVEGDPQRIGLRRDDPDDREEPLLLAAGPLTAQTDGVAPGVACWQTGAERLTTAAAPGHDVVRKSELVR